MASKEPIEAEVLYAIKIEAKTEQMVVIRMSKEAAKDIFSETGDLIPADFPALMKLAEAIADVLVNEE